jgi:hypothetical protein
MVVAATAMSASSLSAILLGSFVSGLVVLCRKLGRDPGATLVPTPASKRWFMSYPQITSPRLSLLASVTSSLCSY